MGGLIDKKRRAAARQARQENTVLIRKAAVHCFANLPYVEVSLDTIGRRAGARQGAASLLFRSKEELLLKVASEELGSWYDALAAVGAGQPGTDVTQILVSSLGEREALVKMLGLLPIVLAQNLDFEAALAFLDAQRERLLATGQILEEQNVGVGPGEGARLLFKALMLAAALGPLAYPSGTLAMALQKPEFSALRVDFGEELRGLLLRKAVSC